MTKARHLEFEAEWKRYLKASNSESKIRELTSNQSEFDSNMKVLKREKKKKFLTLKKYKQV